MFIEDLQEVYKELFNARTKWYNIGLELRINPTDLDVINMKFKDDPDTCLRESLSKWLKQGDSKPMWATLVSALKCPTVGFNQLSEQVQKRHLSSVASHISWDKKESGSHYFQCPCTKCNLITYLDKGCPKTSSSSYPYLSLNNLSKDVTEDLIQKLSDDTAKIIQCFADLLTNTCKSLEGRQVTVSKLVSVSLDLGVYKSGRNQIPLLKEDQSKLEKATSIDGAFNVLRNHMSFFNYEILGHIIKHLGDESDQENFEQFCSNFTQYCQRKLFEAPPTVFHSSGCEKNDKQFVVLGTQYLFDTLTDVKAAQRKIATILNLRASTVQLKKIDIGSVILVFSIPGMLKDIFPLTSATDAQLKYCGYTLIVPDTCTSQADEAIIPQDILSKPKPEHQERREQKFNVHHSIEMGMYNYCNLYDGCKI